jgi:hypothetical protein
MKVLPALSFNIKLLVSCMLLFSYSCTSQTPVSVDSSYTLLHTISLKAKAFTTDKLSQVYLVTEQNEVIKFDPDGKELFRFSNNTLGNLEHIDVTDPFNVLLYYPDYLAVLTLDRTLNITLEYDLTNLNLLEVKAIGMSNDNNVWLYDEVIFKLRKVDRKGQVVLESDELNMVLYYTPEPNFILERANTVYVNNPETGILVFDIYGRYIKTLDFKGLEDFQVFNNQLIFRKNEKLMSFHLQPLVLQTITLPPDTKKEDKIRIQKNKLFVKKKDRLLIYEF